MKIFMAAFLLTFSFAATAGEVSIDFNGGQLTCNWGELTSSNTEDLGTHSSDPDGDGASDPDPRVGLANVIDQGSMEATCNAIRDILENY